jgi:hypothetical protein
MKMVQVLKSTKDFDICGSLNPGTVRVSTENSKAKVISSRCAIFRPATAEFRLNTVGSAHFWPHFREENCDALAMLNRIDYSQNICDKFGV